MPNLYDYKYRRTFAYRRLRQGQDTRGEIGIPRVLGMYENYPLWFTILTQLGFRVIISGRSNHELFESGMDSIPSKNVGYDTKLGKEISLSGGEKQRISLARVRFLKTHLF